MGKKSVANDGHHQLIHNFIALQKQYFMWVMTPETCKTYKTLEDLSVDAKLTSIELQQITQSYKCKEALSQLELNVLRNNTFIRFNRCFDAVDRILQNENLCEGTVPQNFHEKNILNEAGMDFYELVGNEVSRRDFVGELRSMLTLKALSADRYLKSEDEGENIKVRYIKALSAVKNNELVVNEDYESFSIDRNTILGAMGEGGLYLPPKHQEMLNGGEMAVKYIMLPTLVYKKYLKIKSELQDEQNISIKNIIGKTYHHNQAVWLKFFLEVNG